MVSRKVGSELPGGEILSLARWRERTVFNPIVHPITSDPSPYFPKGVTNFGATTRGHVPEKGGEQWMLAGSSPTSPLAPAGRRFLEHGLEHHVDADTHDS